MADSTAHPRSSTQAKRGEGHFGIGRFFSLYGLSLLFSLIGTGIAGYLTYAHFDKGALVCSASGGCHTVQESQYATIGPIPIAALGLGMFLVVAFLATVRIYDLSILSSENATMIVWGITLTALLYYAYLTYIELFVLEAICQWCVGSALATIGIFATESVILGRDLRVDDAELE